MPPGSGAPPPNKPGGSGPAVAVAVVAVVVMVAALVGIGVLTLGHVGEADGTAVAAGSSAATDSRASTPTTEPEGSGSSTGDDCAPAVPGERTPDGWQTVAAKRDLAYDVPPSWQVASCSTLIGWEAPCPDGPFGYCPVRTMSGAAYRETRQCPDDWAGAAGVPGAKSIDDIDDAVLQETTLVAGIYTSESGVVPDVELSEPRSFTVGDVPAVQIVATVTGIEPSDCAGDTALHSMVATTVPGQEGSVLFVISLAQGMPGAVDPEVIDQMVSSLRPAR